MVWWSARRWIAQPLEAVVAVAERVAEGDFTSRIEVSSNDEIGNLMHAFSKMQSHLADTIREVRNTVTSVASDASQLRASAQTVAQGSQEQSDAAASMAASVEQMSASIAMISQHAEDAQEISRESEVVSRESSANHPAGGGGNESYCRYRQECIGNRGHARQRDQFGIDHRQRDQGDCRSDQPAGPQRGHRGSPGRRAGAGFAVVADEVRKLAERTTKSTHEITEMIARIQKGAEDAVVNMDRGAGEVSAGVDLAALAGEAIQRIRVGAGLALEAVEGISAAIREQSIASSTVAKGLETIAR
jgi:methyl-accepting chemotaxis protein-2 (aspartate sensor receptor)